MVAQIKLRNRAGEVVAIALVDDEDYQRVMDAGPWYLDRRYVAHNRWEAGRCRKTYLHRVVLGLQADDPRETDHMDHNRLNNQKANLRAVTQAQNQQNRRGSLRGSRSKYRGVTWRETRKKWEAQVRLDGYLHHLGRFADEAEAGQVAADFRKRHMPFSTD